MMKDLYCHACASIFPWDEVLCILLLILFSSLAKVLNYFEMIVHVFFSFHYFVVLRQLHEVLRSTKQQTKTIAKKATLMELRELVSQAEQEEELGYSTA